MGDEQIYIPKSERKLAEKLAAKRYLSTELEDLKQEKLATQYYLRHGIAGIKKSSLRKPNEICHTPVVRTLWIKQKYTYCQKTIKPFTKRSCVK